MQFFQNAVFGLDVLADFLKDWEKMRECLFQTKYCDSLELQWHVPVHEYDCG